MPVAQVLADDVEVGDYQRHNLPASPSRQARPRHVPHHVPVTSPITSASRPPSRPPSHTRHHVTVTSPSRPSSRLRHFNHHFNHHVTVTYPRKSLTTSPSHPPPRQVPVWRRGAAGAPAPRALIASATPVRRAARRPAQIRVARRGRGAKRRQIPAAAGNIYDNNAVQRCSSVSPTRPPQIPFFFRRRRPRQGWRGLGPRLRQAERVSRRVTHPTESSELTPAGLAAPDGPAVNSGYLRAGTAGRPAPARHSDLPRTSE